MTLPSATDTAAGEPGSSAKARPGLRFSIVATLVFFIGAAAMQALAAANTDLPPIDGLLRDARDVYLPWLRGDTTVWSILVQTHDAGARLLPITWVYLNGQIDARILALSATVFGLLALALVFHFLSRQVRTTAFAVLAAATAALLFSPVFLLLEPVTGADTSSITVVLSLIQLALLGSASARPLHRVAGFACGALNVLNSSAGIAPALALALWSAVAARRDAATTQARFHLPAAHAALAVCGVALVTLRAGTAGWASWTLATARPIAWPFSHAVWSIVVWGPAAGCIVRWTFQRTAVPGPGSKLPLFALWGGLMAIVSAATGSPATPAIFATGIIVNAACLGAFAGGAVAWDSRRLTAAALWVILLANALLAPLSHRDRVGLFPVPETAGAPALQLALRRGDTSELTNRHGWSQARIDEALNLLGDPLITRILPASIRPPLIIEWESPDATAALVSDVGLAISGSEQLPFFGTRTENSAGSQADYVSRPLRTSFPILLFRIMGELRPPTIAVTLRDQRDRAAEVWSGPFSSPTLWRRVHFTAPTEPFRVVVHDSDEAARIVFTAPVELGPISWLAGKTLGLWPWLLAGGFIAFGISVLAAFRSRPKALASLTAPPVPARTMKLLPWLALATYAVFLSGHLDTTAGPNDSGGYLNTAKLLASGKITASPHAPLTAITTASDVAPYVPGTFRPTATGRIAPNYPIGFPLLVAPLAQLMPLDWAVGACLGLHLIAGVVLVQRLARVAGLSGGWAWLAAGIIALSPVYVFHGLQPMSDVPALVWVAAAIHLAWTCDTDPRRAFLAGVATAVAVLIRPTNVFCVLPILICLAGRWRAVALWLGGGLPFALGLAWLNHTLYGSIASNGYGDIRTMLGGEFFLPTIKAYAAWLPVLLTPAVCIGPAVLFLHRVLLRTRLILLAWAVPFLTFYSFYWCTWDHWCGMRFILPAAPALVIMGLLVLQHLLPLLRLQLFTSGAGFRSSAASAILVVGLLGSLVASSFKTHVLFWLHANREHAVVARSLRFHAPADAIVLANAAAGSVMYYTDLTCLRVDFTQPGTLPETLLDPITRSERPVFAVIYQSELPGAAGSAPPVQAWGLAGEWRMVATPWRDGANIWQREAMPRSNVTSSPK